MSNLDVCKAVVSALAVASFSLLSGCAVAPAEEGDEDVAEADQALTCADATCTGLNPYATSCVLDQQMVSSGPIKDPNGAQLGTVTLYYSQSCHAIWGYAGFNKTHGSFQICATDINNVSQPPQCLSYGPSTFGAVSKMQALRVGDYGYANVLPISSPLSSGSSGTFQRTF